MKNVARTALSLAAVREAKRSVEKDPRARETGACAYNRSGIINRNLLGINLAFVARIPSHEWARLPCPIHATQRNATQRVTEPDNK